MVVRCLFDIREREKDDITFARDKFLLAALQNLNVTVSLFKKNNFFLLHQLKLFKHMLVHRREFDCFVVSSRCKEDLITIKIGSILLHKPVITDLFISTYNSLVEDRKLYSKQSLVAVLCKLLDKFVVIVSDAGMLDTNEHISYFQNKIYSTKGQKRRYHRVLIGSDSSEHKVSNNEQPRDEFVVLYNGTYIPLHGVEFILEAAHQLEKNNAGMKFLFYGDGQQRKEMVDLADNMGLQNVKFIIDYKETELQSVIQKCSVYLGIFGDTDKAKRVIPCKVYKGMAMRSCVLSGQSPAMEELFREGIDYIGTKFGDAQDIANKLLLLKNDENLCHSIAKKGYDTFLKKADIPAVATELAKVFAAVDIPIQTFVHENKQN